MNNPKTETEELQKCDCCSDFYPPAYFVMNEGVILCPVCDAETTLAMAEEAEEEARESAFLRSYLHATGGRSCYR